MSTARRSSEYVRFWTQGAKTDEKTGDQGRKSKKPQFVLTAPYQLFEADITYIHCGADGCSCCFNVVDVFSRKWLSFVFSPDAKSESAVQSVLAAVKGLTPEHIRAIRLRCDNGPQHANAEFRKAMGILGIMVEHIWVSTPQQNCHVESFHNTLKRDYVHTRDFESYQEAKAWLAEAHKNYNANRVHTSIGRVPPDEFLRLWKRNNKEGDEAQ